MAEYKVSAKTAKSCMNAWTEIIGNLDELQQEAINVRQNLSFRIKSREQIDEDLMKIINNIGEHENDVKQLHNTVLKSIDLYTKTENDIISKYEGIEGLKANNNQNNLSSDNSLVSWINSILDLISEYGFIGILVHTLFGVNTSNKLDILGSIFKTLETGARAMAKIIDGAKNPIKYLFGYSDPQKVDSFKDAFIKQFDDYYKIGGNSTVSKTLNGLGVFTKWASGIITVGTNVYENYEEFNGDLDNPRFYGEIIIESAVDILAPIVTTAFIAGLVGVTGGTAALAAPFIVWGIDKIFESLTEDDLAENISDIIFDTGEYIGNTISSTWDNITTKWQVAFS